MSIERKHLAALGGFLSDGHYDGADLKACLHGLTQNLTRRVGSRAKARRVLLQSVPANRRAIVKAMTPSQGRGRPKGSRSGFDDAAYRKAYALYDTYLHYWMKHGKATAALAELAKIKRVDDDTIKRQLARVRKRLSIADRKMIETVATEFTK